MKDSYYNKLLNKYEECSAINMRHSRHTKIIKQLYEVEEKNKLGIKDILDEIVKYLKSRDDRIGHVEKKLKKKDKELEEERALSSSYLGEMAATSSVFLEAQTEIDTLKKENG